MAYSWGGVGTKKLWKATESSSLKSEATVPVCGVDVGSVVLTCQGQHKIVVRDQWTGVRLREISLEGRIENMWADRGKIVTIDRDLSRYGSVTIISMGL